MTNDQLARRLLNAPEAALKGAQLSVIGTGRLIAVGNLV
jgi:hypothetical protein